MCMLRAHVLFVHRWQLDCVHACPRQPISMFTASTRPSVPDAAASTLDSAFSKTPRAAKSASAAIAQSGGRSGQADETAGHHARTAGSASSSPPAAASVTATSQAKSSDDDLGNGNLRMTSNSGAAVANGKHGDIARTDSHSDSDTAATSAAALATDERGSSAPPKTKAEIEAEKHEAAVVALRAVVKADVDAKWRSATTARAEMSRRAFRECYADAMQKKKKAHGETSL
jgi:hypothetical protein